MIIRKGPIAKNAILDEIFGRVNVGQDICSLPQIVGVLPHRYLKVLIGHRTVYQDKEVYTIDHQTNGILNKKRFECVLPFSVHVSR
jgi:hypothetical protein